MQSRELLWQVSMEIVVAHVKRIKKREVSYLGRNGGRESHIGNIQRRHSLVARVASDTNPAANRGCCGPVFGQEIVRICCKKMVF